VIKAAARLMFYLPFVCWTVCMLSLVWW